MLLFFHPICVSARNADSASETFPFCEVLKQQWKQWKQSTALCAATASPVKCEMHPVSSGAPVGATLCHCALCACWRHGCKRRLWFKRVVSSHGALVTKGSRAFFIQDFFYFFNHTSKLKPLWMAGIGIIFALLTFDFHVSDKKSVCYFLWMGWPVKWERVAGDWSLGHCARWELILFWLALPQKK